MSATLQERAELQSLFEHIAETWSLEDRESLIDLAHAIEGRSKGVYVMTPDEEEAVAEGLAQAERGEFVSDEARAAALRRYGL